MLKVLVAYPDFNDKFPFQLTDILLPLDANNRTICDQTLGCRIVILFICGDFLRKAGRDVASHEEIQFLL